MGKDEGRESVRVKTTSPKTEEKSLHYSSASHELLSSSTDTTKQPTELRSKTRDEKEEK